MGTKQQYLVEGASPEQREAIKRATSKLEADLAKEPPKRARNAWVVMNCAGFPGHLQCLRCGALHDLKLPKPVWESGAIAKAFEKEHRQCKPGPAGLHCGYCGKPGHESPEKCPRVASATTLYAWLNGPDTGISSRTIASVLANDDGIIRRGGWSPDTPHDPSDFGRCYRLLKIIPGWRERLGEVAAKYPRWAGLVSAWDEITALYEEELPSRLAPKTYARMKRAMGESR